MVSMETKICNIDNEIEYSSIIIGKLMSISGILERSADRLLLPYELNQQQFSILFEIVKAKKIQQKNIINRLSLEKAHVSKVVKKLLSMGLIESVPFKDDKRSSFLLPTEKGGKIVDECRVIFGVWRKERLGQFNKNELDQILENVDKLQRAFMSKGLD